MGLVDVRMVRDNKTVMNDKGKLVGEISTEKSILPFVKVSNEVS